MQPRQPQVGLPSHHHVEPDATRREVGLVAVLGHHVHPVARRRIADHVTGLHVIALAHRREHVLVLHHPLPERCRPVHRQLDLRGEVAEVREARARLQVGGQLEVLRLGDHAIGHGVHLDLPAAAKRVAQQHLVQHAAIGLGGARRIGRASREVTAGTRPEPAHVGDLEHVHRARREHRRERRRAEVRLVQTEGAVAHHRTHQQHRHHPVSSQQEPSGPRKCQHAERQPRTLDERRTRHPPHRAHRACQHCTQHGEANSPSTLHAASIAHAYRHPQRPPPLPVRHTSPPRQHTTISVHHGARTPSRNDGTHGNHD